MDDRLEALERLAKLQHSGLLTAEELAAEKERILARDVVLPSRRRSGRKIAAIRLFARRYKGLLIGAVATILLTSMLLYIVWEQPLSRQEETRSTRPPQTAAATGLQPTGPDLGELLAGTPGTCAFGNQLRTLVGELRTTPRIRAVSVPGLAGSVQARVEELRAEGIAQPAVVMDFPVAGQWHGLQVMHARLVRWQGGPVASVQIRFADQPARVREVLNAVGFQLPEIGNLRSFQVGNVDAAIGVEALASGTALTCGFAASAANNPEPEMQNRIS